MIAFSSSRVLGCLSFLIGVVLHASDLPLEPLPSGSEPVGFGFAVPAAVHADAQRWLSAEQTAALFDPGARALAEGQPVRAFAEALRAEDSPDPAVVAATHVRRALILARLGTTEFASAHANEAVQAPAVRGELHLARAWIHWRGGDFTAAETEATQAVAATAAPAPAWALAEWQTFQAAHAAAAARFKAAAEPEDPRSPAYLDYVQLALDAGAIAAADTLNSRALRRLLEQREAAPDTAPAVLQQATRIQRDLHVAAIGAKPEAAAATLWRLQVDAARAACDFAPTRDDWERVFAGWVTAQALPAFEFAVYNLNGDLLAAERAVALPETWRQQLKPQLNDPHLRYASRLHQARRRLESDPITAVAEEFFDEPATPTQIAQWDEALARLEPDLAALGRLRAQVPAGAAPVAREDDYLMAAAEIRFRHALAHGDATTARTQLDLVRELREKPGARQIAVDDYIAALLHLERQPFLRFVAELDARPFVPEVDEATERALVQAMLIEGQIRQTRPEMNPDPDDFRPDQLRALQVVQHLRIIAACARGDVLAAENALSSLEELCAGDAPSVYPGLDGCIRRVTTLPFVATLDADEVDEEAVFLAVEARFGDPDADDDAFEPADLPGLALQAAAQWQAGNFAEGDAVFSGLRARVRRNTYAQAFLDDTENRFSLVKRLEVARSALADASGASRRNAFLGLGRAADDVLLAIDQYSGKNLFEHPEKIDPSVHPLISAAAFDYVRAAAAVGETFNACIVRDLLTRYPGPAQNVEASLALVADLPFTQDLPDPELREAWDWLFTYGWRLGPEQQKIADLFADAAGRSITARLGRIVCYGARGPNEVTAKLIADFRKRFGVNRAARAQLEVVERHLQRISEAGAVAAAQIKENLRERQRYINSRAQTIDEINRKNEGYQQKMLAIADDTRRLASELDTMAVNFNAMESYANRLDEINANRAVLEQRASGAWTEYEERDQQRRLAFLDEAATRISQYNAEMTRIRDGHLYAMKILPGDILTDLAALTGLAKP